MNPEHAMTHPRHTTTLPLRQRLQPDDFLHFQHPPVLRLQAESGTLWVTVDGEPDDIQIDAGESRVLDARAPITVGTLGGDAVLSATALSQPAGRGWWLELGAWLHLPVSSGVQR
jgi:hypothetical protein